MFNTLYGSFIFLMKKQIIISSLRIVVVKQILEISCTNF